jgi:methyl-coenzyme M reductase subunit D
MTDTNEPTVDYAGVPLPEVRIMTNRLLSADTTEKVLNAMTAVEHIRQINMTGESIPRTINNGPGKGLDNNHSERKVIAFNGREVELRHLVGAFIIELEVEDEDMLEDTVASIRKVCDDTIPFGYNLDVGRYSKYRPSLHDYRGA